MILPKQAGSSEVEKRRSDDRFQRGSTVHFNSISPSLHNSIETADNAVKMTCPNCGAAMRLDRERTVMVCDYCQTEAAPPIDEDGVQIVSETSKACPGCGSKLSDGLIESDSLLYCAQCHGMLISMDTFVPLAEKLRAMRDRPATSLPPAGKDAERILHCPLCNGAMDNHPYGGPGNINIDSCESCSMVWLDRGELRRITAAPDPQAAYSGSLYSDHDAVGNPDRN